MINRIESNNINKLKEITEEILLPLIDDNYSLLDVPNHCNIGDSLIYEGELAFLQKCAYKKLYSSNNKFFRLNQLPKNGILLFHGGGNFGDLWGQFQRFRKKVVAARPQQKIIIFPQTVYYENKENLKNDAAIFNQHPNLTICARDNRSYDLLKKYFYKNHIVLVPDMAFCLNLEEYNNNIATGKVLYLKRCDKELNNIEVDITEILPVEYVHAPISTEDWPDMIKTGKSKRKEKLNKYLTRVLNYMPYKSRINDLNFGVLQLYNSDQRMKKGIDFLNQFDIIVTTRLHGAILAILLGKRVFFLDNSYGKNRNFHNTWLTDQPNCTFIEI